MKAYLIRTKAHRLLLGIYVCEPFDLFDHVDRLTEPKNCECAELPPGGIFWREAMNIIPLASREEHGFEDDLTLEHSAPTGSWERAFYGQADWTPIPPPVHETGEGVH